MPWEDLAVIPESYATAWTCLLATSRLGRPNPRNSRRNFGVRACSLNIAHDVGATIIATTVKRSDLTCSKNLEPSAVRLRRPTYRSISAIARRSMPCSIWWATLPSWIRCRWCAVEAACVWQDGWAVSIRSTASIHCCKCQAGSTSHSLAVLLWYSSISRFGYSDAGNRR